VSICSVFCWSTHDKNLLGSSRNIVVVVLEEMPAYETSSFQFDKSIIGFETKASRMSKFL
jgi:hypothetical protein